jgi:hypothetical protein
VRTSLGRAALALAERSWAVFPCERGGKRPLVDGGFKAASTDLEQVSRWWRRWPDANIGAPVPTGLIGLDVDVAHGGDESLAALEARHGTLPPTLTTRTGSGGRHYWLRLAGPVRQGAGLLAPGLDTRTAGRGYLIVPPSVHACGDPYRWERWARPAPAPRWLADLLRPKPPAPLPPLPSHQRRSGYGEAALAGECAEVGSALPGQRNARLNAAAYRVGRLVGGGLIGAERGADALLQAGLRSGLSEAESIATIRSGLRAGLACPVSVVA